MLSCSARAHHLAAAFFLGSSLIVSGCNSKSAPSSGVRNSDGSITNADGSITYPAGTIPATSSPAAPAPVAHLNADGSTTNPDGSVTYPAGSPRTHRENQPAPVAQAQPSAQAQPASERAHESVPAPAPAARIIPSGTTVRITTTETLSASHNEVGDGFHGVLSQAVRVRGEEFFHQGTPVTGTVVASKHKGRFKGAGDLGVELTAIGGVRVSTTEYEAIAKGNGKRTGAIIGGGGGLGALIGGLAGGGKGALIGGLAGAGAGTAGAAYTGSRDVVIHSETPLAFTLREPVTLR